MNIFLVDNLLKLRDKKKYQEQQPFMKKERKHMQTIKKQNERFLKMGSNVRHIVVRSISDPYETRENTSIYSTNSNNDI